MLGKHHACPLALYCASHRLRFASTMPRTDRASHRLRIAPTAPRTPAAELIFRASLRHDLSWDTADLEDNVRGHRLHSRCA